MNAKEKLQTIANRMKHELDNGAAPNGERITVRELLSWFGYARRGRYAVNWIRHTLTELDLRTVPDFEVMWIDASIAIELDPEAVKGITASDEPIDPTVRIGAIEAANRKPISVHLTDSIRRATTLMQTNDFSQLPVMETERVIKGVVSWKSIGTRFSLGQECEEVRHCMDPFVPEIHIRSPMFDAIGDIMQYGYVLVRNEENRITGIVTSSDIAHQFMYLAGPFLIIGEIEGYLRSMVHRKFTVEEMNEALPNSERGQPISGPEDLTLGGYCYLLGQEEFWNRLNLNLDRKEFVKELNWVREKRNDVMHFDPEGLEPQDTNKLENFAMLFRKLRRLRIV